MKEEQAVWDEANERQLLTAIANGEQAVFRACYDAHVRQVFNVAMQYAKHQEDAEEITQEVFVKLYKHAHKFKGESKLSTWLYRVTVNHALNYIEKRKRRLRKEEEYGTSLFDQTEPRLTEEQKARAAQLMKWVERLPARQQTAFNLSFIQDMPRQDVADVMELSLKAVESLLQRAKQNLRKNMDS